MISEQLKISILKSAKSIWKQICTEQSEKKESAKCQRACQNISAIINTLKSVPLQVKVNNINLSNNKLHRNSSCRGFHLY